jgi:hypothetical protein
MCAVTTSATLLDGFPVERDVAVLRNNAAEAGRALASTHAAIKTTRVAPPADAARLVIFAL